VIVLEAVFLAVFWTWVLSAILFLRNTFLPRMPITVTPEQFQLSSDTVRFQATDGMPLEGWKISTEPSRPWIILCHGVGSNRSDLLEIAAKLHDARFNLLLFDFRGHGGSRGRVTSFGYTEQRDLEGALVFLGEQTDVPAKPYGVYGISMGASVALTVAARDERLGAVAADSPYVTLEESLGRHLALLYPVLPRMPFLWCILATYRLRFGVWPRRMSPLAAAAMLSPRPLLLLLGGDDIRTPLEETKRLYAAAGQPKDLCVVEGAAHLQSYALDPRTYILRLVRFFEASLMDARRT